MPTATESDDELLASLEPGSFAVFYRRHVEDLVAFFMRRTRNAELAADLTAETFAAALVARARFDPGRGSASAWLFGIALHKLARVERREAAERRARRRLGMERIELTDADIERIEALGSGPRAHVLLERISLRRFVSARRLLSVRSPPRRRSGWWSSPSSRSWRPSRAS